MGNDTELVSPAVHFLLPGKKTLLVAFLVVISLCEAQLDIFGTLATVFNSATPQSVRVIAKLNCNGEPAEHVKVKLYEEEALLDILLLETYTNATGEVDISGTKSEKSWIEPKINFYHKCEYTGNCYRKFSARVPKEYITEGSEATKTFDLGEINLASKFTGTFRWTDVDCFN